MTESEIRAALGAVTFAPAADLLFIRRVLKAQTWPPAVAAEAERTIGGIWGGGVVDHAARWLVREGRVDMPEVLDRHVALAYGVVRVRWSTADPDTAAMAADAARLPGSTWVAHRAEWTAPLTIESSEFVAAWDFGSTPQVRKALKKFNAAPTTVYGVVLGATFGTAVIRRYNRTVALSAELLVWARAEGLSVDPAVEDAITVTSAAAQRARVLSVASRAADPNELSPEFLALLERATA